MPNLTLLQPLPKRPFKGDRGQGAVGLAPADPEGHPRATVDPWVPEDQAAAWCLWVTWAAPGPWVDHLCLPWGRVVRWVLALWAPWAPWGQWMISWAGVGAGVPRLPPTKCQIRSCRQKVSRTQ